MLFRLYNDEASSYLKLNQETLKLKTLDYYVRKETLEQNLAGMVVSCF
jgi:hypothetical protein